MRKIYQSAPDVPQVIANKAIDIVEKHLVTAGVRRAEELPEESRVHLFRELQRFFETELPPLIEGKEGEQTYAWGLRGGRGLVGEFVRWIERLLSSGESRG